MEFEFTNFDWFCLFLLGFAGFDYNVLFEKVSSLECELLVDGILSSIFK